MPCSGDLSLEFLFEYNVLGFSHFAVLANHFWLICGNRSFCFRLFFPASRIENFAFQVPTTHNPFLINFASFLSNWTILILILRIFFQPEILSQYFPPSNNEAFVPVVPNSSNNSPSVWCFRDTTETLYHACSGHWAIFHVIKNHVAPALSSYFSSEEKHTAHVWETLWDLMGVNFL